MLLDNHVCFTADHWPGRDFLRSKPQSKGSPCPFLLPLFSSHRFLYNRPFKLLSSFQHPPARKSKPAHMNRWYPRKPRDGTGPKARKGERFYQICFIIYFSQHCNKDIFFFFLICIFCFLSEDLGTRKIRTLLIQKTSGLQKFEEGPVYSKSNSEKSHRSPFIIECLPALGGQHISKGKGTACSDISEVRKHYLIQLTQLSEVCADTTNLPSTTLARDNGR